MTSTTDRAAKPLGFWPVLALVVGNMVGSGIYLLPATLAPLGANAMLGWIATIAGALCLAFVFARLGAAMPVAGGPYAFAQAAFGPAAGFATAWSYWTLIWAGNAAVAVAVVSALSLIMPALASHAALAALGLIWLLVLVNIRGIALVGQVQLVTTLLKLIPLVGVILLAGWMFAGGEARVAASPVPIGPGAIAGAAALTFWGFLGLESATVPADKVADARRVVPRATLIGTVLAGIVYLAVTAAITTLMPTAEVAASPAPVAAFLGTKLGAGTAAVVALFAAVSAFGTLNGFILLQGEVCGAMGRGGVFPAWFGKVGRNGTPVRAHLVSGVLVTIVTLLNYARGMGDLFQFIASVSLAAGMLAYFASALAAIRLLPGDRVLTIVAAIAAAFVAWLSWGLGAEANIWALVLLVAGAPVYFLVKLGAAAGR
jgi:APA family basic amino acid/polyamine antiporter